MNQWGSWLLNLLVFHVVWCHVYMSERQRTDGRDERQHAIVLWSTKTMTIDSWHALIFVYIQNLSQLTVFFYEYLGKVL
jgi:hypothetical protein